MSVWEIELPAGLPLLNSNQRLHHHPRARATRRLRHEAMIASLAARVPYLGEAFVLGYVHPAANRRFDSANFYPSFKAAVDGALVDAGVVPDDDHLHVSGPHMYPAHKIPGGQLRLIVMASRRCRCGHDETEHIGEDGRCVRPGCGCLYHRPAVAGAV
ncbi:crossover junction endodeoxyribonuclease RusA [Nocardiopsis mwathae]|uniref:Crossover junction endodeoxyribonuclease RusA n=1 Tax=Nocardiopsis mwathae TaxID=1472723 RepID=A0A7W9YHH9_9ACTN|nr:hypothetical protein [Nocardiopsis mwathae]MBB6172253.1 crossover junction endodeoxyribonuclease RusA [Nocardiopsis mwathae]